MVLLILPEVKLLSLPDKERFKRLKKERVFNIAVFMNSLLLLVILLLPTDIKGLE